MIWSECVGGAGRALESEEREEEEGGTGEGEETGSGEGDRVLLPLSREVK